MPNDINKLRRLMRRANYIKNNHPSPVDLSFALSKAWWFESLRDALNNGMARIEYLIRQNFTYFLSTLKFMVKQAENLAANHQRPCKYPQRGQIGGNKWLTCYAD